MRLQCDGTNTGYLDAPVIVRCAALHCAVRRSCTRVPGRYCYITAQDRTSRTRRGGCRTFRGSAALPCPALPSTNWKGEVAAGSLARLLFQGSPSKVRTYRLADDRGCSAGAGPGVVWTGLTNVDCYELRCKGASLLFRCLLVPTQSNLVKRRRAQRENETKRTW